MTTPDPTTRYHLALAALSDEAIARRFTKRWVGSRVHMIVVAPTEAADLYMGQINRGDSDGHQYVESATAAIEAAQCPPPEFVQRLADNAAPASEALRAAKQQEITDRRRARDLARAPWKRKEAA